jgi:rhamnulokinase
MTASILASLARRTAEVIHQAADLAGKKLEVVHIVGGGSQNGLLNQLIADASGLPVVAGPVEATLMGNLLLQFEAAGELLGSIRDTVRAGTKLETFEPTA